MSANQKMELLKSDCCLLSSPEDYALMKQAIATHTPDGRDLDARPILRIVENTLADASTTIVRAPQAAPAIAKDRAQHGELVQLLEALSYTINRIAREFSSGEDEHATTITLLEIFGRYSWDAKVVLTLVAFTASIFNPLAKSVALPKKLPENLQQTNNLEPVLDSLNTLIKAMPDATNCIIKSNHPPTEYISIDAFANPQTGSVDLLMLLAYITGHINTLKPHFDALKSLIKAMIDVTKCIVELKELPTEYISSDSLAMTVAASYIPIAVYWTIRTIVACSSQTIGLTSMGQEYISLQKEVSESSSLANKVKDICTLLNNQLNECHRSIEEKRNIEDYHILMHRIKMIHIDDNMEILKLFIHSKDGLPIIDGITKRRVNIEVLRKKIVILFISDLDIFLGELMILEQIHSDAQHCKSERAFEIVWLPVIDKSVPWTDTKQDMFLRLASSMPWYSLYHPSLLEPAVIKYIREVWHFEKKPLLVVIDGQGSVVCPNAQHMLWIWGNLAFPFTSLREEALWEEQQTWTLEFLVDEIDPNVLRWVREGKHVCLYGGEDLDWIRKFTTLMRQVANKAGISLEMVYVGTSNPKERVRKIITAIREEKLSGSWQDLKMIWFFWLRLESMWYSKMSRGRTTDNDTIMQEVMTLLSYDGSDRGWALISTGSTEMISRNGPMIVDCLSRFDTWKESVKGLGFISAIANDLENLHSAHLILPATESNFRASVVCAVCRRPFEKYIMFTCPKRE